MNKKIAFLEFIEKLLADANITEEDIPEDARLYWIGLKNKETREKPLFTDNGKLILEYMREHCSEPTKARDIAEGLFISARTVSGAVRKLVTDGFVEKVGADPVLYNITEKGKTINI